MLVIYYDILYRMLVIYYDILYDLSIQLTAWARVGHQTLSTTGLNILVTDK